MRLINMRTLPGRVGEIIKGTLHACVNSCGVINVIIFFASAICQLLFIFTFSSAPVHRKGQFHPEKKESGVY